jgi:hypothetical protein
MPMIGQAIGAKASDNGEVSQRATALRLVSNTSNNNGRQRLIPGVKAGVSGTEAMRSVRPSQIAGIGVRLEKKLQRG